MAAHSFPGHVTLTALCTPFVLFCSVHLICHTLVRGSPLSCCCLFARTDISVLFSPKALKKLESMNKISPSLPSYSSKNDHSLRACAHQPLCVHPSVLFIL
ncbi:MAG: hypothetical protein J3Q66DRAFT_322969 [Benniella sp.]|nr:MAG: hypothetical protein J3Q66DRAFT_322969 [Benniella sp.]